MRRALADVQLERYLEQMEFSPQNLTVAGLRSRADERSRYRARGPEMYEVRDLRIGRMRVRLYRPVPGDIPLLIFLHGGGWTIGNLATHDRMCRRLASQSRVAVLAVEFRLAPEHPWPAAVDDAVEAVLWATSGPPELEPRPRVVAIGGDSSGGTLATLACLRLRDDGSDSGLSLQVLLYANTDLTGSQPSMTEMAHGWGLDADAVRFFGAQWVPDALKRVDPRVSPLFAQNLSMLPKALVVTAEFDPLRDECEAYAAHLAEAGVEVILRREVGLIHGFMTLDEVSPACAIAAERVAHDLGALLHSGPTPEREKRADHSKVHGKDEPDAKP